MQTTQPRCRPNTHTRTWPSVLCSMKVSMNSNRCGTGLGGSRSHSCRGPLITNQADKDALTCSHGPTLEVILLVKDHVMSTLFGVKVRCQRLHHVHQESPGRRVHKQKSRAQGLQRRATAGNYGSAYAAGRGTAASAASANTEAQCLC